MAREVRVQGGMSVRKVESGVTVLDHRPAYNGYTADITLTNGPSPGAVSIGPNGTNVNLVHLGEPGWVEIVNRHATQTIQFGLWDPNTTTFYPFGEVEPGQGITFKLSRNFGERHDEGVGTGTTGLGYVLLRFYSGGTEHAVVYVGAFSR